MPARPDHDDSYKELGRNAYLAKTNKTIKIQGWLTEEGDLKTDLTTKDDHAKTKAK